MKKYYILIILLLSFSNLFSEWKLVDSLEISMHYYDMDCVDNLNCFSVGNSGATQSTYVKTTDGGYSWEIIYFDEAVKQYDSDGNWVSTIPPKYKPIRCIDYITPDFAVAGHTEGQITITQDGGLTWDSTQLDIERDIIDINFIDSLNGAALSYRDIFITHDAGVTWERFEIGFEIKNFQMIDENTIYAGQYQHFLKTTNSGKDWEVVTIPFHSVNYHGQTGMHFINKDIGWISARMQASSDPPKYTNVILKTIDAGKNWEIQLDTLLSDMPLGLYGIYFADEYEGLAWGEGGIIWRTENGGEDWIRDKSYPFPTGDHFSSVAFPDGNTRKILANVYIFRQIWMYEKGTSVKHNEEEKSFNIFPNPVQNYLQINPPQSPFGKGGSELASRGISDIAIYNVLGEKVMNASTSGNSVATSASRGQIRVDVSNLTPGVYFIKIGDRIEKFVKE